EASSDRTDRNPGVAAPGRKQQAAHPTPRRRRLFVADDHEAFALDAFDLDPVTAAAGSVGSVAVFGDDALKAERAGLREQFGAVSMGFFRQLHRAGGAVEEIREQMPTNVELGLGEVMTIEIEKVE